jgi:hypothetical protein
MNVEKNIVTKRPNETNPNKKDKIQEVCSDLDNIYNKKCNNNKRLLAAEEANRENLSEINININDKDNILLYPHLDDPNFNVNIALKKEFNDTKYDGTI